MISSPHLSFFFFSHFFFFVILEFIFLLFFLIAKALFIYLMYTAKLGEEGSYLGFFFFLICGM